MAMDAAVLAVRVISDTSEAEAGLNKFSKNMQGHARSLGAVGVGMTGAFTAPLVGIATGALKLAADFEQSMNMMEVAGNVPAAAMAKLEAQALSLGATTVFSAGDVADAMLELTKSGMSFDQVGESIQGVTELAAAGGIELGEAASVTSQYLNSFGLDASKAGELANLLAGGANASAAEVYDLAKGGVQAAGAFADMGAPAADLITALAILSNRGQDATKGGTNLNQMMQDLAQPTIKARKEMKRLGIDLFDVNGEFIGLVPTIDEFNEATAGMTMEQREVALGMIMSGEGLKAMRPLLETTGAGFAKQREEIEAEGQAAALAQARMKGLAGGMEYLSGSIDSFLIGTAKPFLDVFNEIVIGIADAITGIGDLPDPVKNAALAFGAVLAAAGPLIGVAAAVAFALSALGTAAAPILLVVGAVALLAAGFAALYSANLFGIQDAIAGIGSVLGSLAGYFRIVLTDGDALNDFLAQLPSWMQPAVQGIGNVIVALQDFGRYIGMTVTEGDALNDWLSHLPASVQPAAQAIGNLVVGVQDAGAAIRTWATQLATQGLATQAFQIATQELPERFRGIAQGIGAAAAALQTLGAAITGGASVQQLQEFQAVMEQTFGPELANQIAGMGLRVRQFVAELQTIKPGELFGATADFASDISAQLSKAVASVNWAGVRSEIVLALGLDKLTIDTSKLTGAFDKVGVALSESLAKVGLGTLNFDKLRGQIETTLVKTFSGIGVGTLDFSKLRTAITNAFNGLQTQITAAWDSGGWSGLGALAIEKITQLGADIGTAFGSMVTLAQLGLVLAAGQVATAISTAFGAEGATLDMSSVGAWAQRQADAAKAQLDAVFGEGNLGSTMIQRVQDTVGRITETLSGMGDMTQVEQFNAGVVSILEVFGLLKGLNLDAITGVTTGLTTLATGILDFSTKMVSGLDATKLADMFGGVATEISDSIAKAFDAENLTKLGEAAGTMVSTLVTKLGELLSAEKFGEDVGAAVVDAAGAVAEGAASLVTGFADEISKTPWNQYGGQLSTFTQGFVEGATTSLKNVSWDFVGQAIVDGLEASMRAQMGTLAGMWGTTLAEAMPGLANPAERMAQGLRDAMPTADDIGGIFSSDTPAWVSSLIDSLTTTPPFITSLITWSNSIPVWVGRLMSWIPSWALKLLNLQGKELGTPLLDIQDRGVEMSRKKLILAQQQIEAELAAMDPVQIPVTPVFPPAGLIDRGAEMTPITVPVTPAFTIPFEVPDFAEPVEVPAKPKFPPFSGLGFLGISGEAIEVPIKPVLASNVPILGDILSAMGGGGGGDEKLSVRVEASSVTAAAGMQPLQTDAIMAHFQQPATPPTLLVTAKVANPGALSADGGASDVAAKAGSAISSSLSGFKWPPLPPWTWTPYPNWTWTPYNPWIWPPIARPDWLGDLRVPRPDWIGELLSWSPTVRLEVGSGVTTPGATGGGATTGLAGGTNYWRGGWTKVGERGEEYVNLPRGSKVFDHKTSMAMAGAGGDNISITVNATVSNDIDLNALADKLTYLITARQNRRG